MSALAQSPQYDQGPAKIRDDQILPQILSSPMHTARRLKNRQIACTWHERFRLGFAKVTGLVRIHTRSRNKSYQTITSAQYPVLWIQMQMPKWLCTSVLEAAFSRSYAGWTCSMKFYGHFRKGSVEFHLVTDAIRHDDVDAIHHLFQERKCGPLDRFVWDDLSKEANILEVSCLDCYVRI